LSRARVSHTLTASLGAAIGASARARELSAGQHILTAAHAPATPSVRAVNRTRMLNHGVLAERLPGKVFDFAREPQLPTRLAGHNLCFALSQRVTACFVQSATPYRNCTIAQVVTAC
jgi:hypothetical protein